MKHLELLNKTIIISGGLGFLGQEFARTLKDCYANVILLDLEEKVEKFIKFPENVIYKVYACDVTNELEVNTIISRINDHYGIDILINCHAINPQFDHSKNNNFETYSLEKWKNTLDVNLTGAFLLSRECIKYMLRNQNDEFKGTIVNIGSDLGLIASDHRIYENRYKKPSDYGVSKAGLIYLTKYIAGYYEDKIKSVCLVPGSVYNGQSGVLKGNLEARIPLGRLAKVDEYNEAIKFLCSSGSDYMQGQALIADGGRSIW